MTRLGRFLLDVVAFGLIAWALFPLRQVYGAKWRFVLTVLMLQYAMKLMVALAK
jgi:hypothetical protein